MPKPAAPPAQVTNRYSELEEKIRRLKQRQSAMSLSEASQTENNIQIAQTEMDNLEQQFGFESEPVDRITIVAEPMEFSAEEILEEQSRPISKAPKKRIGRTVASRYNHIYKSKTKRDY
tara:strand:- start:349 stop:705 length:357 start_codon:yes stop_codon:yes gene_type:complete